MTTRTCSIALLVLLVGCAREGLVGVDAGAGGSTPLRRGPASPADALVVPGVGPEAGAEASTSETSVAAGPEGSPEAGREVGPEAGSEPGPEAGREAGAEPGPEAGREVGAEPGPEVGREAGPEPAPEVGRPAGPEAGPEVRACDPACMVGCNVGCSASGACLSCATCTCDVTSGQCHC